MDRPTSPVAQSLELRRRGERLLTFLQRYLRLNNRPNNRNKAENALSVIWALIRVFGKRWNELASHRKGVEEVQQAWLKVYMPGLGDEIDTGLHAFNAASKKEAKAAAEIKKTAASGVEDDKGTRKTNQS